MQAACDETPSTMAAVLGLEDNVVEDVCNSTDGVVVAANYNCPGQLVISGEVPAIEAACAALTGRCTTALVLPVGGAFHSPLMESARERLAAAIAAAPFRRRAARGPKRKRLAGNRPGSHSREPHRSIDCTRALDAEHAQDDRTGSDRSH